MFFVGVNYYPFRHEFMFLLNVAMNPWLTTVQRQTFNLVGLYYQNQHWRLQQK